MTNLSPTFPSKTVGGKPELVITLVTMRNDQQHVERLMSVNDSAQRPEFRRALDADYLDRRIERGAERVNDSDPKVVLGTVDNEESYVIA